MGASCLQDADDALVVFSMAILRLSPTLASESREKMLTYANALCR